MYIKNEQITKLKSLLYSKTESGRITINQAVAYAIVMNTNVLNNVKDVRISIKNIVNEVCELAIMDRVALEKAIVNMYKFANIKTSIGQSIIRVNYQVDFESALAINELIGKQTIAAVNENMRLFNNIVQILSANISDILDEDDD